MVLENTVLFGSVNAGRHCQQAADALAAGRPRLAGRADHPAGTDERVRRRLHKNDDDVKVVVDLTA
jgi:hypothetical protein